MAGLLAARVLTDYCDEVTLIERDTFPTGVENRRGVPQGRHTHGLLSSGCQVLEDYFPGIGDELVAAGAISGDICRDARYFLEDGCVAQCASNIHGLLMSRPFLEARVRARVLALPKIRRRDGVAVEGLAASADSSRITGVRIGGEGLAADLVVDATGRGSKSPQWLKEIGYEAPAEETIQIALGYTSRFFRRNASDLGGALAAVIPPTPAGQRGGVMLAQEGDRWTVTLISYFRNYAPDDVPGFVQFSRTLPGLDIYDTIRDAEPLGDAVGARFPASLRRRYERLSRFPQGYVVFGDAISSFNPVYGQGMSVAALQSLELRKCLAAGTADLARRFFAQASKVVDIPWTIAAGNDLRIPEVVGPRNAGVNFINWYMAKLAKAAHHDPVLALAFHTVGNLLAPPPSLMAPRMAWRVFFGRGSGAAPKAVKARAAAQ